MVHNKNKIKFKSIFWTVSIFKLVKVLVVIKEIIVGIFLSVKVVYFSLNMKNIEGNFRHS